MFDDQINKSNPPVNLPTEPADMFAGVEKDIPAEKIPDALGAGLLKKKDAGAPAMSTAPMVAPSLYEVKQPILGKVLFFIVIVVVLGAAGFGGWYAYDKFIKNKSTETTAVPVTSESQSTTEVPAALETPAPIVIGSVITSTPVATSSDVTAKMNNDKILFGEALDSDKDGLDDVREKELGTNQFNADSDADGLSDGDEVIIWKTNPTNSDTDGDSYKDGEEVRNGYNPLGAGKLFNIPAGATTSTATSSANNVKK